MSGLELAVVALGLLSCLSLVGVAVLLVQVRTLRRTPNPEPSRQPSRELRTVRSPVESDASVRLVPSVVAETSLSAERALPAEPVQPLVRVMAVAHGVRCALAPENRDRIRALVRRDIRRR